jgi:hypothetical protein
MVVVYLGKHKEALDYVNAVIKRRICAGKKGLRMDESPWEKCTVEKEKNARNWARDRVFGWCENLRGGRKTELARKDQHVFRKRNKSELLRRSRKGIDSRGREE